MKSISLFSGYIYLILAIATGIIVIALDKQKIQTTILVMQKIVGVSLVKLSVVLRKPLEAIPVIIARIK